MALLKCPECGKVVSEFARECPECGCPMSDISQENQVADKSWDKRKEKSNTATQAYSQEELNRALAQAKSKELSQQQRKPGQKRIIKNSESVLQRKNKKPPKKLNRPRENPSKQRANMAPASLAPKSKQAQIKRQNPASSLHRKKQKRSAGRGGTLKIKIILIAIGILLLIGVAVICFSALADSDGKQDATKDTMSTVSTNEMRETQRQQVPSYQSESSKYSEKTWQGTVSNTTEKETKPVSKPTTQRQTATQTPTQPPSTQPTETQPEEPVEIE